MATIVEARGVYIYSTWAAAPAEYNIIKAQTTTRETRDSHYIPTIIIIKCNYCYHKTRMEISLSHHHHYNYQPFSMQGSVHLQFKRTPRFLFALPPTQQPEFLFNYIYPEWIAIHCDSHTCCTWNTLKSSHMQTNSVIIIFTCCLLIF